MQSVRLPLVLAIATSCAACTSPPAPTLISDVYDASWLNVQGDTVFFQANGYAWRTPVVDGQLATPLYESGCGGLLVNATALYFFGAKNADGTCDLMTAPIGGGPATVVAPGAGPAHLDMNDSFVVVVTNDAVSMFPLGGGAPYSIPVAAQERLVFSVAMDTRYVYWDTSAQYTFYNDCFAQPFDGSEAARISCNGGNGIAVHDGFVYANSSCTEDGVCGGLWKTQIGGAPMHIASSWVGQLTFIGEHTYWNAGNRIVRGNLELGDQTDLYEVPANEHVSSMAFDDQYLYFSTGGYRTAIWRTPK